MRFPGKLGRVSSNYTIGRGSTTTFRSRFHPLATATSQSHSSNVGNARLRPIAL
jgi:hypothetical protein